MAHFWNLAMTTASWFLLQQSIVCVLPQTNEACSSPGEVRLTGGATEYSGVVEYCYSGEYHSLCSTGNTTQDRRLAEIVCREILNTTDPDITASYVTNDDVGLLQLTCTPSPTNLTQCTVNTNCSSLDVACHGSCDNNIGRCRCIDGWGGTGCRTAMCDLECLNGGSCFRPPGECDCTLVSSRWGGERCNQFECSPVCGNRGVCVGPGECDCASGYTGSTCLRAVCNPPCENGGRCNRPGQPCICPVRDGWTGQACTQHTCYSSMAGYFPSGCLNGGTCVGPNNCSCTNGWRGNRCQTPVCESQCLNGGTCTTPGQCTCAPGWTGDTCDEAICLPGCENGGNCFSPDTCTCTAGWSGPACSQPICDDECQNGGTCTNPNECSCTAEWSGDTCTIPYCPCENGGTCVVQGNCSCTDKWEGPTCTQAICSNNFCANGGNCSYPDTNCTCPDQWAGLQCLTAQCEAGFCENGGTCLYPDTNCTCPDGWGGDKCEIGPPVIDNGLNLYIVLGAGVPAALVAFCILCIAIPIRALRNKSKILKHETYRESPIPGNEYEISTPIVNPFTSGHALEILNPAMKKTKNKHNSPAPTEPAHETAADPVPPEVQNIQTRAVTAAINRWQITAPDDLSTAKKTKTTTPPPSSPNHSKTKDKEAQKSGMSEGWSTIPCDDSKTGESQGDKYNETVNAAYGAIHDGNLMRLVDNMQLHTNAAYETLRASTLRSVTKPAKESPLQQTSTGEPLQQTSQEESLHDYTEVLDVTNPTNNEKDRRNAVKFERKPTPPQHVEVFLMLDAKTVELYEPYYEELK